MKTNTLKLLSLSILFALLVWSFSSSYAMGWNGNGNWKWSQWWKQNQEESMHNPWDLISNIEPSDLNETERLNLLYSYAEESLAYDMYMYFYELYGVKTFYNIAQSEAEHKDAVKSLLDRYSLDLPTDYWELNDEFESLKNKWELSLKDAFEVWISIEMLDIEDIANTIKETDNDDIKAVFVNIGWASYNHLRWFVTWLTNNGYTTELNYNDYLTDEEIYDKSIVVKQKMAEKVVDEWVVLPEWFSAESIKQNCLNNNNSNQTESNLNNREQSVNQYMDMYRASVKSKYYNVIQKLDESKKSILNERIDNLIIKIDSDVTIKTTTKDKYKALLLLLKEMLN